MNALEQLRARQQELLDASAKIVSDADGAGRDITDEEVATIAENKASVDRLAAQITARESAAPPANGNGRRTPPAAGLVPASPRSGADAERHGFKNFGEFAQVVKAAALKNETASQRMANVATTFSTEGIGVDGGFAVPPEFRREIAVKVMGEDSLISRTDRLTTSGNSLTLPKDESTPWQTSGGVLCFWESEAGQISQSKIALEQATIRLNKLTALVPVSEELLEDAPGLEAYLRAKAPTKMNAKLNTAILSGTGVGQPLGLLNSPSLVTVAKEVSQVADSIMFENIVKMESQFYNPNGGGVWLINQNCLPQLMGMKFDSGATSPVPVWLPANGLAGQRYSTLMGKPVIPLQACKTVGDLGDIILADMSAYMTCTKGQDVRVDVSMHLFFDQALTAFRFIMRVAGQPWWSNTITQQNASEALGSFVTLADRA